MGRELKCPDVRPASTLPCLAHPPLDPYGSLCHPPLIGGPKADPPLDPPCFWPQVPSVSYVTRVGLAPQIAWTPCDIRDPQDRMNRRRSTPPSAPMSPMPPPPHWWPQKLTPPGPPPVLGHKFHRFHMLRELGSPHRLRGSPHRLRYSRSAGPDLALSAPVRANRRRNGREPPPRPPPSAL